jgi:hypothetical protein
MLKNLKNTWGKQNRTHQSRCVHYDLAVQPNVSLVTMEEFHVPDTPHPEIECLKTFGSVLERFFVCCQLGSRVYLQCACTDHCGGTADLSFGF